MIFNKDFNELLSIFNDHEVKYLIVGGYAVAFHAQPRATKDLDILIKPDAENGGALYSALAEFGAPLAGITAEDLIQPGAFFRMGTAPLMVEIFPAISGVDFEAAWGRRVEVAIEDAGGQKACLLSESDLVASKIAAGRPQDLADIDAIRNKARALLTENES
ncbi:MAG TPA: DUF6036 family nucleotidyltransferase [Acidisarcina sp.]